MIQKINEFQNIELENQIVSTLIKDEPIFMNLPPFFEVGMFYHENSIKVVKMVLEMAQNGEARTEVGDYDLGLLLEYASKYKLQPAYLSKILSNYSTSNFIHNLQHVKELHLKRQVTSLLYNQLTKIDNINDISDIIDDSSKALDTISNFESGASSIEMQEHVAKHRKELAEKKKMLDSGESFEVKTGLKELDNIITGWMPSELVIIGARPSMGKTAATLQFLLDANKPSLFLSLEMGVNSLINRYIVRFTDINSHDLRVGKLNDYDFQNINNVYSDLEQRNIFIDDFSEENVSKHIKSISAKVKMYIKKYECKVVFIDYLGLLNHSEENNNIGLGRITKIFKAIAKEYNVCVVLLHQLNRGVESRADKRPALSDLRDSGEIEQDADVVIFIYRDDYYTKPEPEYRTNEIEFLIRKNRQGKLDELIFKHNESITEIYNTGDGGANEMPAWE